MKDDAQLLAAWRVGDQEAGSALFERHFQVLHRFFATKVNEGIEDLIQATLLACVESRDRVRDPSGFRSYLLGVARYQLLGRFREKRRAQGRQGAEPVTSLRDGGPSPSSVAAQRQELLLLLKAMRRIPLDLQIALELFYWEQFSTEEIARVLAIPQGTAKSRLRRAREQLRDQMEALGESAEITETTMSNLDHWARSLRDLIDGRDTEG